jgi:DNA segregation ATPase FtsK/SpoIIIE-like protein
MLIDIQYSNQQICIAIGEDVTGHSVITDLAQSQHILITGAKNSGKTSCWSILSEHQQHWYQKLLI